MLGSQKKKLEKKREDALSSITGDRVNIELMAQRAPMQACAFGRARPSNPPALSKAANYGSVLGQQKFSTSRILNENSHLEAIRNEKAENCSLRSLVGK